MATNKETTTKVAAPKATTAKTTKPATAKSTATKPAAKKTASANTTPKAATAKTTVSKPVVKEEIATQVVEVKKTVKPSSTKVEYVGPKLKITLVRSPIGSLVKQKRTLKALGLSKIRSSVIKRDDACTRGMIFVVRHLVSVEEVK